MDDLNDLIERAEAHAKTLVDDPTTVALLQACANRLRKAFPKSTPIPNTIIPIPRLSKVLIEAVADGCVSVTERQLRAQIRELEAA